MLLEEKILKVGEWVIVNLRPAIIGYITSVHRPHEKYQIKLVRTLKGRQISGEHWLNFREVRLYEIAIEKDDLHQMLDLSLATKDKQWFEEIQERLTFNW